MKLEREGHSSELLTLIELKIGLKVSRIAAGVDANNGTTV